MNNKHVVYVILMHGLVLDDVDPDEFKYAYVGYTNDFERRMGEHLRCTNDSGYTTSAKLYNRLRKYGWDNFDKIILMSGLTEEEAKDAEIDTISKYNTFERGMNSTPGGDGGPILYGANNRNSEAVNIHNNSTGEIISFLCQVDAAKYLGINPGCVTAVVSSSRETEQTYSPAHEAWFQVKYVDDQTPFVENMSTRNEKLSFCNAGYKNSYARAINIYNNSTGEVISFLWQGAAAEYLGVEFNRVSDAVNPNRDSKQTYSPKYESWFQIKYADDKTPFIKNMLSPKQKHSIAMTNKSPSNETRQKMSKSRKGEKNPRAKPVCAFGKIYPTETDASNMLREVCDTTSNRNFIGTWINSKKHQHIIFNVTKDFYKKYKNTNECVTREMYDQFISSQL